MDAMVAGIGPDELPKPEALFRLGKAHELRPSDEDREVLTHLARRVASCPADLLSHTRRILLADACGDAEEAFAALVDLLIATGGSGRALKEGLLSRSAPLLSPLQQRFLSKHCRTGLTATSAVASIRTVLTSGAGAGCIFADSP